MVPRVAMQGVYRRTKTINANADSGDNNDPRATDTPTPLDASMIPKDSTTISLARSPNNIAATICQAKPNGANIGCND